MLSGVLGSLAGEVFGGALFALVQNGPSQPRRRPAAVYFCKWYMPAPQGTDTQKKTFFILVFLFLFCFVRQGQASRQNPPYYPTVKVSPCFCFSLFCLQKRKKKVKGCWGAGRFCCKFVRESCLGLC